MKIDKDYQMTVFMRDQTINGESEDIPHRGGLVQIAVYGVFDGAIATLEVSHGESGFLTLDEPSAIFNETKSNVSIFQMVSGATYRLIITNAGGSTNLSASALS